MQATSNGTAIGDVQRTDTRACRAVPPAPRPAARKHASQPPTSAVRAARLPTHAEPRPQLIIPNHARCCCCRSPLPPPPPLSPAAAVHCRRAAGRHRQRRPQLHAQPDPAGYAVATTVHRHVQRCPCAVSPPPMPQAVCLHAQPPRVQSGAAIAAAATAGLLKERLVVLLLLLLHYRQYDAIDVVLRISVLFHCCGCGCGCCRGGVRSGRSVGSKGRP